MTSPVQLASTHGSHDLVDILDGLLDAARQGLLSGLVFGAAFKGQRYYCDAAGTMHRNPVVALGLAHMLAAELTHHIRHEALDTVL